MALALASNRRRVAVAAIILAIVAIGIASSRPLGLVPGTGPGSNPGPGGSTGSGDQAKDQGQGAPGNPVAPGPVEVVWHGFWISFGYEERTYLVIQTEEEWRALWAGAALNPPQVDFRTKTVLVALNGLAPTTGHDISIDGVTLGADGRYTVSVEATHPGARCTTAQVLTHPVHMVSILKAQGSFDFRATDTTIECH